MKDGVKIEQSFLLPDGRRKGLQRILQERGIPPPSGKTKWMRAAAQERMAQEPDFKEEKSHVERLVEDLGGEVIISPKYHPEFSPVELAWAFCKRFTRRTCGYSIVSLRLNIPRSLELITEEVTLKLFDHVKAYRQAYSGGAENGATAKARVLKGRKDRRDLRERAPLKGAWADADAILWAELRDVLERVNDEASEKDAHQEDRAPELERVQELPVEEHSGKESEHSDALQTSHRPVSLCRYLANIAEAATESVIGRYAQARADGQAQDEASETLLAGRTPRARRAPRGRDK
jgi:hypothetical protein